MNFKSHIAQSTYVPHPQVEVCVSCPDGLGCVALSSFQQLHTLRRPKIGALFRSPPPRILPNLCNFRIYCQHPPERPKALQFEDLGSKEHRKKTMGTVVRPCRSVPLPISVSSYLEIWLCRRIWYRVSVTLIATLQPPPNAKSFFAICFSGQGVP